MRRLTVVNVAPTSESNSAETMPPGTKNLWGALRPPFVTGDKSLADVTRDICAPLDRSPTLLWWGTFSLALCALLLGVTAVTYQIAYGIGTWGLNRTVGWAFDITNFVFWVGIGHAGTLISAVLFLFRQKWRTSVNRSAEAMTLFAVICAGTFPLIHMGRPWLAFWTLPYPNTRGSLWVNFKSPLLWDVFAISTYLLVSAVFWYIGLVPDLATVRDRSQPGLRRKLASWFSLGWNGSARTWHRYETVYMLLAGLATPLVFSVHSIVSMDFATAVIPGWHTTIFPPYFVAGAIFSGLAMVLTLMIIARKTMRLEDYITVRHLEAMCKLMLAMGSLVGLAYGTEFFIAFFSGNPYEQFVFLNRALGPFRWAYWTMVCCNVVIPQVLWFRPLRTNVAVVFLISIVVNIGMWFERFVIIVTSLHRDFLPSSWSDYTPTTIEIATLIGSFGLFFTCFLLFGRFLPVIAMAEVKGVLEPSCSANPGTHITGDAA
jgi:molybdopterin-containing oxidoreductase family membrane subunit